MKSTYRFVIVVVLVAGLVIILNFTPQLSKRIHNVREETDLSFSPVVEESSKINAQEVAICVVVCGDRLDESLTMLKSALVFSKRPLKFIIITEENLIIAFEEKLSDWKVKVNKTFTYTVRPIKFPVKTDVFMWKKLFKPCAAQRLFLPALLNDTDAILYVDTDTLFLAPPELVWDEFKNMNSTQLAALSPEHEDPNTGWYNRFAKHPYYGKLGVNSGVMLMNLTRMRIFRWDDYVIPIHKEYKLKITPDHCMYMSVCTDAEKEGALVIHGSRGTFHSQKQPPFRAVYRAMQQYQLDTDKYENLLLPMQNYLMLEDNSNCVRFFEIMSYLMMIFYSGMPLFKSKSSPKLPVLEKANNGAHNIDESEIANEHMKDKSINGTDKGDKYSYQDQSASSDDRQSKTSLVFHCQLAHGSTTGLISGFKNVRELYEKIAECWELPSSEILFCTLNTAKIDMNELLGGQIGLDDFIFAHRKGRPKEIVLTKTEDALGLTITDNGAGYAFIKRIKEGSVIDKINVIQVGDHIERINSENLVGKRHFEVAKRLKEIPKGSVFTLRLIEPQKSGFESIGPRGDIKKGKKVGYGTGKDTLRFKADGSTQIQTVDNAATIGVEKINCILENFMGINDNELATQIWELADKKSNSMDFAEAIDNSDLEAFGFTDDFVIELWGAVTDARSGRFH
ncbi:hypothetical protein PV326_010080 [Microctonus aethiopoides]|nr:hypothetical protein PV326_010080 [Microctonus aethiopoides]